MGSNLSVATWELDAGNLNVTFEVEKKNDGVSTNYFNQLEILMNNVAE